MGYGGKRAEWIPLPSINPRTGEPFRVFLQPELNTADLQKLSGRSEEEIKRQGIPGLLSKIILDWDLEDDEGNKIPMNMQTFGLVMGRDLDRILKIYNQVNKDVEPDDELAFLSNWIPTSGTAGHPHNVLEMPKPNDYSGNS